MKEITIRGYEYNELSDKAKEKAADWLLERFDNQFEWDSLKEDAKEIGLELASWDYGRYCKGKFLLPASQVIEKILGAHGSTCETYKTAFKYKDILEKNEDGELDEESNSEFLRALLEDYRIIFDKESDYKQSEEGIVEAMEANSYLFTEKGKFIQ
jgi:hypothetical protein